MIAHVTLSASEPEPNFNSLSGATGPATAPPWAADTPSCAPAGTTTVWQYGEVGQQAGNIADIDEFRPGMPGLVSPDGSITASDSGSVPERNLVSDSGFNGSAVGWQFGPSTNFAVYPSGTGGANAFEGSGYLATNTSATYGGIFQDIPTAITRGQTFCASMELTTAGSSNGGSGVLALWLLGTTPADSSSRQALNLPGNSTWTQEQTCVVANGTHNTIRVQFYPPVNGPTIAVDDVSVTPDRAVNGGFNGAQGTWNAFPGTNFVRYLTGAGGSAAYEGTNYMAMNTNTAGGSVYQDIPTNIIAGNTFCATAQLTSADSTGAGGALQVWLLGISPQDDAFMTVSNLPGHGVWASIKVCVQATSAHSTIRVQFYPTVGGPTVGMDVVSVL
jgi:hypothetical protein